MTFEIMPPTWRAILPVMLDARANISVQLDAIGCDGAESGWCSVHNDSFEADRYLSCETRRDHEALLKWRTGLRAALKSNTELFEQMAAVADLAARLSARPEDK